MPTVSRTLTATSCAALAIALSGCGAPATAQHSSKQPPAPGVTQISEMYGPRCNEVPLAGAGSPVRMAADPVGVAVGRTPLLTEFSRQLHLSGLESTLDTPTSGYTVFAPADDAFEPVPTTTRLGQWDAHRDGTLRSVLGYHVVPKRYDAGGLLAAGTVRTLDGAPLSISGDGLDLRIGGQRAKVLCGDIPTANATVFIINQVLSPPASAAD